MFSHRAPSSISNFVTLFTSSGANITASPGHYIWVMENTGRPGSGLARPVRAQDIKLGDCLIGLDATSSYVAQSCVVGKTERLDTGLYNPHTASGSIVVNGIGALTFTDTLPPKRVMHTIVTMPARLVYLALKAVRATPVTEALNNALLIAYFKMPGNIILAMLSGKQ